MINEHYKNLMKFKNIELHHKAKLNHKAKRAAKKVVRKMFPTSKWEPVVSMVELHKIIGND